MIAIGSVTYSIAHISSYAHVLTESGYITARPGFQSWLVDDHLPRAARYMFAFVASPRSLMQLMSNANASAQPSIRRGGIHQLLVKQDIIPSQPVAS
ncbi:unnamed protein product [Clonostachys rosea f. rosea IK726]|uniref:Uncharacterized protein n=1 Tax=Clonostachys rosea f. rosea IK726 TaxID=1349383 RepID=A0ACA9T8Z8_BIOOC|nr:unnamed protein product [Clonostachys rosea f. rosea IK726]